MPKLKIVENKKHFYHCIFCGKQLYEIELGGLECECGKRYIPFYDKYDNPSLTCIEEEQ